MIRDEDIRLHRPEPARSDWAETGFFNFYIPDANILGFVYVVHRVGIGATVSDVEIVNGPGLYADDSLYIDLNNHNPLVEKAEEFRLETGLSFRATSIRDYVIDYRAPGVELHIDCTSVMEPYDIHDPAMDPMAVADSEVAIANSGFGAAYAAHFDMTVRMTGSLSIGGTTFPIDCISTMDHSWGPRPENGFHPILWANAHFGPGDAVHGIFSVDRNAPFGEQHLFKHGYAIVDGRVRGAKAGSVRTHRPRLFPTAMEMTIVDCDDREHVVWGSVLAHHPWMPYGNSLSPITMARWHAADGRTGIGTYLEAFPLNEVRMPTPIANGAFPMSENPAVDRGIPAIEAGQADGAASFHREVEHGNG